MSNSIKSFSSAESVSSPADNNNIKKAPSKSQRRRQRRNEQKKRESAAAEKAAVPAAETPKAEAPKAMAPQPSQSPKVATPKVATPKVATPKAMAPQPSQVSKSAALKAMAPQLSQSQKAVASLFTASPANASQPATPATPLTGLSASRWASLGQAASSSAAKRATPKPRPTFPAAKPMTVSYAAMAATPKPATPKPATPQPKAHASKGASHGDNDKALTATPTEDGEAGGPKASVGTPMSKNQRRKANKLAKMAEDQARTGAAMARAGAEVRREAATAQAAVPAVGSDTKGTDGPASVIVASAAQVVADVAKPIAPSNHGKTSTSVLSFSGKGKGPAVPFTFSVPTSSALTKPASVEKQKKMAPVGDVSPEDVARDIENFQKEVSERDNRIRSQDARIREMEKHLAEQRAQLKKIEDERHDQGRTLMSTVSQLKSVRQERSGLADELNHLEAEKRETAENLDKARKEADNAVESKLRLQAQLEEAQIEIGRLHQFELAVSESSENLEVLNANFEALQLELQARNEELLVLRQEHHDEVSSRDDEDSMGQSTSVSRLDSELLAEAWDNLEDNFQGLLTFSPVVQLVNSPPSPFSLSAPAVPLPLPATQPTFLKRESPEPQVPMQQESAAKLQPIPELATRDVSSGQQQQAAVEPEEKPALVKQEDAGLDGKNIQQEPEERAQLLPEQAQQTEEVNLPCRWPAAEQDEEPELVGEAQRVSPNTNEGREPKNHPVWLLWLHMVLMWVFGPFVAPIRKFIVGTACPGGDEAARVELDLAILASLLCLVVSLFSTYSNLRERSLWLAANEQTRRLAVHYQGLA